MVCVCGGGSIVHFLLLICIHALYNKLCRNLIFNKHIYSIMNTVQIWDFKIRLLLFRERSMAKMNDDLDEPL